MIPFITAAITLLSMVSIIVRLDWQLALVALAISPILFVTTRYNRRRLRRQSRDVKKVESSALGITQKVLGPPVSSPKRTSPTTWCCPR